MNDYSQFLTILLPAGGFALQWMRQHASIPESRTVAAAVGIAAAVYVLCLDWAHLPQGVAAVQHEVLSWGVWMVTAVPSVLGGTFTASKLASTGKLPIPETNSK